MCYGSPAGLLRDVLHYIMILITDLASQIAHRHWKGCTIDLIRLMVETHETVTLTDLPLQMSGVQPNFCLMCLAHIVVA